MKKQVLVSNLATSKRLLGPDEKYTCSFSHNEVRLPPDPLANGEGANARSSSACGSGGAVSAPLVEQYYPEVGGRYPLADIWESRLLRLRIRKSRLPHLQSTTMRGGMGRYPLAGHLGEPSPDHLGLNPPAGAP